MDSEESLDQREEERKRILKELMILQKGRRNLENIREKLKRELDWSSNISSKINSLIEERLKRLEEIDREILENIRGEGVQAGKSQGRFESRLRNFTEGFIDAAILALIGALFLWPRTPEVRTILGYGFLLLALAVTIFRLISKKR